MRLFVALEVPDGVRRRLDTRVAPLRDRWGGLRWTPPHQWHLTIAFLGGVELPVEEVAGLLREPAGIAPPVIDLRLAAPGRFGKRVLWVGVAADPEGAVRDLGAATQQAFTEAGLPVDDKPVHPHVTLARSRGRDAIRPAHVDAVPHVEAAWQVSELVLFDSVPAGHGQPNRYEPLATIALGA